MTCDRLDDVAPELALGVLDGEERAGALRHLAACVDCRVVGAALGQIADSLLLLVPAADPPLGFESRVAARVLRPTRRRRRATKVAAALAGAALVGGIAAALFVDDASDDPAVTAAPLATPSGSEVGRVWSHDGDVDWLFMTVDSAAAAGRAYTCEAVLVDGRVVRLGAFRADGAGRASWARPVGIPVDDVVAVRMRTDDGKVIATARLTAD